MANHRTVLVLAVGLVAAAMAAAGAGPRRPFAADLLIRNDSGYDTVAAAWYDWVAPGTTGFLGSSSPVPPFQSRCVHFTIDADSVFIAIVHHTLLGYKPENWMAILFSDPENPTIGAGTATSLAQHPHWIWSSTGVGGGFAGSLEPTSQPCR